MAMMRRLRQKLAAEPVVAPANSASAIAESRAVPINQCRDRSRVAIRGVLQSVREHSDFFALEAQVVDDTETVTVIWLGRRHIEGIAQGRPIAVFGRIGVRDGQRVMFNPAYELRG